MRNLFTQIKQSITFFLLMVLITFTVGAKAELHGLSGVIVTKTQGAGLTSLVVNSSPISDPAFVSLDACTSHVTALKGAAPQVDTGGDATTFTSVRFYILAKCSPLARNQ